MKKVGLTGNIGSGKTTISHVFKILGISVFNSDMEAKRLMIENQGLKNNLVSEFGVNVFLGSRLNRQYLSKISFSDKSVLDKLNQLVHPVVQKEFENWSKN